MKIIVSGGGTAGHINPALGVAQELKNRGHEILFVGAKGKMEMKRIPAAGFDIIGLPIMGFRRSFKPSAIWHNIKVPIAMIRSTARAKTIIKSFKPNVVVGFGGYASAPIVKAAQTIGIETILQEQNSFAGLTNRILAKHAKKICVAYQGMERFFDSEKIVLTGNPFRGAIMELPQRAIAAKELSLSPRLKTILVTGGSLGTRTLNEMVVEFLKTYCGKDIQVIWQCGNFYYKEFEDRLQQIDHNEYVTYKLMPFIEKMECAYAMADVVVCRSGASTVSELQLLGIPTIFIPSPNVAEDHQTANARSVVEAGGALMVKDSEAVQGAMQRAVELIEDESMCQAMKSRLEILAKPNATTDIADIICQCHNTQQTTSNPDKNVYFIGIGGIGMSALARFFKHQGYNVAGYDRVRTLLCENMEEIGIDIHYTDSVEDIPLQFLEKSTTQVIYTPAIPKGHKELQWFLENDFRVVKRAQALGVLCEDKYTMAVAGTHGKSSTTTMVAWLNHCTSTDGTGSAFLGAISKNFETNTIMGTGDRMAVEADEFDRSFHQLHPSVSLITAADPDHLDIYGSVQEFRVAFQQFIAQTKEAVIMHQNVELTLPPHIKHLTYSLDNPASDYYAKNITPTNRATYKFDMVTPSQTIERLELGIPGKINLENLIGAIALIDQRGFDAEKLHNALITFKGIERRFDMWLNYPEIVYMDDYAHHPEELKNMILSLKDTFPLRKITVCFQPHLYTRTRDFVDGFATSLSMAHRVILLPIYPAREEPIEGITSQIIFDKLQCDEKIILSSKEELPLLLENLPTLDVVVTAGAGDIDTQRQSVNDVLVKRRKV